MKIIVLTLVLHSSNYMPGRYATLVTVVINKRYGLKNCSIHIKKVHISLTIILRKF